MSRFGDSPMALTLTPRGVAACSPWCKPRELELNKTQAPDGNAVTDFEVAGFARIQGTLCAMT